MQQRHTDINFRKLFIMVSRNWYWLLIGVVLAIGLAYLYNRYTLPTYRVSTSILIEEATSSRMSDTENLMQGFGLRPGAQNLDNQILILKSFSLVQKAIKELSFELDIYRKGLSKKVSFYPLNPVEIVEQEYGAIPRNTTFSLLPTGKDQFRLKTESKSLFQIDTIVYFNRPIVFNKGSFTIKPDLNILNGLEQRQRKFFKSRRKIYFRYYSQEPLVERYRHLLSVETASREGTIVRLSLEGTNKSKDIVFLDNLTKVFLASNLEKKNHEARRIIEFIDEQLVGVSDSLMITENELQEFRSRNRIMDVSAQGQQIIDQAVVLENERAQLTLQSNYYDYLSDYLSKEANQEVPISPGTMEIQDPVLGALMQELAGLQAEYFSSGVGERNPLQAQLELKIQNTKQSLRETLHGIKLANQMGLDENSQQIQRLNNEASRLPIKERQLLGIERKFNLNNVLYTFLLQKKAEAQIQKASNKADNELVDPARSGMIPIAPKKRMIYLMSFLLGLGLPFITLLVTDTMQNKISSEEDLRMITNLPLAGYIPHSRLSYNTVVLTEPQSRISESFRSLRTKMEFFTKSTESPVILITSTMPGEGKTFTAINLASAYSLADKKTVLIGFDLRRPKVSSSFGLNGEVGLSTYLIGKKSIKDIVVETEYPNLYVIPTGPIPPNPGELTSSDKVKELFKQLKKEFDFIIVDSAPIGAVSDGYSIATIADATLIMVRHGHTNKRFFDGTLNEAETIGVGGLSILMNDVRSNRGAYRYSYNYSYNYSDKKGKN